MQELLFAAPFLNADPINFQAELKELDSRLADAQDHVRQAINLLKPVPGARRFAQLELLEGIHRQITAELRSHGEFPKTSRVHLIDWIICWLARELSEVDVKEINKDIATLLNAAEVPGGGRGEHSWSPEAVKKRRARFAANPLAYQSVAFNLRFR